MRVDAEVKYLNSSWVDHLSHPDLKNPFGGRREPVIIQHLSPASTEKMDLLGMWSAPPNSVPDSSFAPLYFCHSHCTLHCYPGWILDLKAQQGTFHLGDFVFLFSFGVHGNKGFLTFSSSNQTSNWLYCKKKRSTRKVIFQHLRSFKFYQ